MAARLGLPNTMCALATNKASASVTYSFRRGLTGMRLDFATFGSSVNYSINVKGVDVSGAEQHAIIITPRTFLSNNSMIQFQGMMSSGCIIRVRAKTACPHYFLMA